MRIRIVYLWEINEEIKLKNRFLFVSIEFAAYFLPQAIRIFGNKRFTHGHG